MNPSAGSAAALDLLIVDDEPAFRQGLRRLLHCASREFAFRSIEATGGANALEILDHEHVDCVLLDFHMPGGNGLSWLSKILTRHENLPVVMVTGHGDEETAVAALKSGAMDYLVKGSISPESLVRAVANAVEKVRMRLAIDAQRRELIEAEKQRVMIQSLGAACHHMGQPATNIVCWLEIMKRQNPAPEMMRLIEECSKAADAMAEVLHELQRVSSFRTVPYRPLGDAETARSDDAILDVRGDG